MIAKKELKIRILRFIFGCFFAIASLFSGLFLNTINNSEVVYAEPATQTENVVTEPATETEPETNQPATQQTQTLTAGGDNCKSSLGAIGWLVCPTTGKIAEAVDWLYEKIEDVLVINPVPAEDGTPIYEIWKYCRGLTNIVFIIFLLVVIYSQITGIGISNYGVKKAIPKLIIAAIMVNLSFLICSLAVDVSNIIGHSLREVFVSIQESALAGGVSGVTEAGDMTREMKMSYASMYSSLAGGTALAVGAGAIAFETGAIWMLIPTVLGAIVAVASGLITIALRQAVVALLIMISPLAMVANILPNTEKWFNKWKELLYKMLIFYPTFSLLFGASQLAGFAIIASAKDGFGLLLGMAVQIFPLFFSWKLMQMSGTFLGAINAKIRGFAAAPLATNRAWADSRRQQTRAYNTQYSMMPYSRLQRFLDNRRALRENTTASLRELRKNDANIYVQRKIGAGYDGSKVQSTEAYLKPNKYTRIAKDLSNSGLASETAAMDTKHTISNYNDYYVDKRTRRAVKVATDSGNTAALDAIKASDAEYRRGATGAHNFLEFSRAQMTAENDSEADFNFMVSEYLGSLKNYDPNNTSDEFSKYRHYILSSAGGLGEVGQTRVLGKIIARAAAVESSQRRDINIIAAKFPHAKRDFRNMFVGYYVDDDGFATDKEGNRLADEIYRGYLLQNEPEKLVLWDHVDDQGRKYYDWYDNGQFVTRIYETDSSAFKELLSNYDAPINDPINNLYGILAGMKPGPSGTPLEHIGLNRFRTTIGRALLSAPFKEKNAAFSPMVAEMIKNGYIQNYAQENLAYLDSLNKATKPGAFNVQDGDAIDMFIAMMDPDRWEEIFPTDLIRGYRNVNGEPIYGIRYDEDGHKVKVPANEATREELMNRIVEKYIIPAGKKITVMMSRQTQNTMDNQKAGTAEKWKKLKEVFDTKWGEGKAIEADPYRQDGDMREITRDIRDTLYTVDADGNRRTFNGGNNRRRNNDHDTHAAPVHVNHAAQIFEIYNSSLDADEFATSVSEYCSGFVELAWIAEQVQDFIVGEGYGVTKEQIYEYVESLLPYVDED